jgi:hypothetical protein
MMMLHQLYYDWYCPATYLGGLLLFANVVWCRHNHKKVEWHAMSTYYVLPGVVLDIVVSQMIG